MIKSLFPGLNNILKVRKDLGAYREQPIYLVTRIWSGRNVGDGKWTDKEEQIYPIPGIRDHSHNLRIQEGGAYKQGDLIVTNISKDTYPLRSTVDGTSDHKTIEKFYKIGEYLYTVIHVKENHLTWHVQVRRHSNQGDPR